MQASLQSVPAYSTGTPSQSHHFEWIDVLRGLACLGVVLFHSRVNLWIGWEAIRSNPGAYSTFDRSMAWLSIPMPFMGSGVLLFFLLSGFCIHYPSISLKSIEFLPYIIRRMLRIFPPFCAAILFSIGVEWVCSIWFNLPVTNSNTIWRTFSMTQNYFPCKQLNSNPSLWSLPVEVELYIVYPLLFVAGRRIGNKPIMFFVSLVSLIALYFTLNGFGVLIGNFMKYWIIWCSGAMLAVFVKTGSPVLWKKQYWFYMALCFIIAIYMTIIKYPNAIIHFFWGGGYFFFVWFCLTLPPPSVFFNKTLLSLLRFLGQISYSLYLIHFPLFTLFGAIYIRFYGHKPFSLGVALIAVIVAVGFGYLFYRLVEKPAHLLARRLGKQRRRSDNLMLGV